MRAPSTTACLHRFSATWLLGNRFVAPCTLHLPVRAALRSKRVGNIPVGGTVAPTHSHAPCAPMWLCRQDVVFIGGNFESVAAWRGCKGGTPLLRVWFCPLHKHCCGCTLEPDRPTAVCVRARTRPYPASCPLHPAHPSRLRHTEPVGLHRAEPHHDLHCVWG